MSARQLSAIASIAALTLSLQTSAMAGVVISGDYYEQTAALDCPSDTVCRLNLLPIPSDKFVDVQNVNCRIQATKFLKLMTFAAVNSLGNASSRKLYFPVPAYFVGSGEYYYAVNEVVNYRVGASPYMYFTINLESAGTGTIYCTVTGKMGPR